MFSWTCSLLKMDASSDHFLETFIKYQLKTTVRRQIRSEQISFSVTVLKHCIIVKDNSFLESNQNQRCFNVKFRRWFNVDKLTLFRRWNTVIFNVDIKILIFQTWYMNKIAFLESSQNQHCFNVNFDVDLTLINWHCFDVQIWLSFQR